MATHSSVLAWRIPGMGEPGGVIQSRTQLKQLNSSSSRRLKRHRLDPWVRKILCSRKQHTIPVFLSGKLHIQWGLAGYSLGDCKEWDVTEYSTAHTSVVFTNALCCAVLCLVTQSCPTLCDPMDCSPPGSSVHGDSPGKNTGGGCHALLQGNLPNSWIKPRSPALQVDFLQSEPPVKPKNTGMSSLSLLQGIFWIQKLNQGLLQADSLLTELPGKPPPMT